MIRNYLCLAALCAFSMPVFGSIAYNNTLTDTGDTAAFSANEFAEIGDQIYLFGTQRVATSATVQFFNQGGLGTFDGSLRLFHVGGPVGAQIGTEIQVTGIAAPAADVFSVVFTLPNVLVPDELIFTLSIANQSAGVMIIGPNLFDPPTVGSSDNSFYIVKSNGVYSQESSGLTSGNLFFELIAESEVPEPATLAISTAGLLGLALLRRRK